LSPYYGYYKRFSIWKYLPTVTRPNEDHLHHFLSQLPPAAIIADLGSGGRFLNSKTITFDRFITENTRVIGDMHNLPFKQNSIDCVICTGTLEHIDNPWAAVDELFRVVKQNGKIYIVIPFMQGYHPDPSDFWRFTETGLIKLCGKFNKVDSGCFAGGGSGLSWALVDFFRSFSDNKYISELLGILARLLFFWVKYFDLILIKNRNNNLFASGYFFIGEKK
jgi:SAM-dependent methyltransferase